jgi:hypothetical protein
LRSPAATAKSAIDIPARKSNWGHNVAGVVPSSNAPRSTTRLVVRGKRIPWLWYVAAYAIHPPLFSRQWVKAEY